MPYDPQIHHRQSIRLRNYDYSTAGCYFVTLCIHDRDCLLGAVEGGRLLPSEAGEVVRSTWETLPGRYPAVTTDAFVIMPNHVHGILLIGGEGGITEGAIREGAIRELPLREGVSRGDRRAMLLPKVIGFFKMNTAREINRIGGNSGSPVWQRNYYERVLRNEDELHRARRYIQENPSKWELDRENPLNAQTPDRK